MAYIPPPSHNSGDSLSITPGVIAYLAVALIVWIAAAVAVALHQSDEPNGEDIVMGVIVGAGLALLWPFSIVAGGIWLLVRHLTRPRTTITTPED